MPRPDLKRGAIKIAPLVATAVLYGLAFPPLNLGLLVFVALVPWLLSLREATPGGAFRGGYTLGVMFWATQMSWLIPLTGKYVGSPVMGLLPLGVCCFLGAWYFAILGWSLRNAIHSGAFWAIPLVWAGVEVIRGAIPHLAFPYGLLATPLWQVPILAQGAYFGTIYLVSAWVAAVNALVFVFMSKPKETPMGSPYSARSSFRLLLPVVGLLLLSGLKFSTPSAGKPTVVTAGQPGVDLAFTPPDEEAFRLKGAVAALYADAVQSRSRLLVLPEGIAKGENDHPPLAPFAVDPRVPVVFGGQRFYMKGTIGGGSSAPKTYQSAFGYDGKWTHADKARLVIFGEYVPGRGILPFLDAFKLPAGDLSPAEKTSAIEVGGLKVGPLICFEGLFFDVAEAQNRNGAQVLAAMSIDDWYMGTGAPDQLRSATVWRAIETGLPAIRAGGLGYSMIIDGKGRVIREAPLGETKAISATLYIEDKPAQNPIRPWFAYAFGLSFPILAVCLARSKPAPTEKKRKKKK